MKDIVLKAVIGVIITALWGFCVWFIKRSYKRQKATEDGLRSLLRAEIIRTYEKTRERGYCPIYSKQALSAVFEAYTNLDGNGVMPSLYEFVLNAPTEPPGQP